MILQIHIHSVPILAFWNSPFRDQVAIDWQCFISTAGCSQAGAHMAAEMPVASSAETPTTWSAVTVVLSAWLMA